MKETVVKENDKKLVEKTRNTTKIYFFIIAIVALLATNVYFYVKFRTSGEKISILRVEKENLQIEIDRIEAELDKINFQNLELSESLKVSEEKAREVITSLRAELDNNNLSEERLLAAQEQIRKLKSDVSTYRANIDLLKADNELLQKQNSILNDQVSGATSKALTLEKSNKELQEKVSSASALKLSNVIVNGLQNKRNNNVEVEARAKRVDKLEIKFTVVENALAKKGPHPIYFRIINPQGNLIVEGNNIFYVHGEKLQYTFHETINFTNFGEEYKIEWADKNGFSKGAYTILMYSDSAIMGRSTIIFK